MGDTTSKSSWLREASGNLEKLIGSRFVCRTVSAQPCWTIEWRAFTGIRRQEYEQRKHQLIVDLLRIFGNCVVAYDEPPSTGEMPSKLSEIAPRCWVVPEAGRPNDWMGYLYLGQWTLYPSTPPRLVDGLLTLRPFSKVGITSALNLLELASVPWVLSGEVDNDPWAFTVNPRFSEAFHCRRQCIDGSYPSNGDLASAKKEGTST